MKRLVRPVLVVTLFSLTGQIVSVITQVVVAAAFGAGVSMDAFLAASTLPRYIIAVLVSTLGFVFVPVFVDYARTGLEDEAWRVASGVINLCLLVLGGLAAMGVVFARPLLQLTTPGLNSETLHLASQVARITWPAILATGVCNLLIGIYQAQGRFGWPAAVPVIGILVNLGLILILARSLGVIGMAVAGTTGVVLQMILLLPIALRSGRYRPVLPWRHPGVQQVIHLFVPLLLTNALVWWTPVMDRFLASRLPVGSISHLDYALKLVLPLSTFISTGLATVIFPRMAERVTVGSVVGLKYTVSLGLRVMWLAIAPVLAIGEVLALPLVSAAFLRGRFSAVDAEAVAGLLRVYLLALAPMSLGNITGRVFYALKDTRTLAVMGIIEALAYIVYTPLLASRFGVTGIAWGYVVFFNLSFLWHLLIIRYKTGNAGGRTTLGSFARTSIAALLGGGTAWVVVQIAPNAGLQLFFGGGLGLVAYVAALLALRSSEAQMMLGVVAERIRVARHNALPL